MKTNKQKLTQRNPTSLELAFKVYVKPQTKEEKIVKPLSKQKPIANIYNRKSKTPEQSRRNKYNRKASIGNLKPSVKVLAAYSVKPGEINVRPVKTVKATKMEKPAVVEEFTAAKSAPLIEK